MKYDFSGWATRNDLKCSDGRTIRKDAFKDNDGETVPLVWAHQHNDPADVLGHAMLKNCDEGVRVYGTFNDTENGELAKMLVQHGDIKSLSIYANHLKSRGSDVMHGTICEVSLVHKGANPGAYIDTVIAHSDDTDEEAVIYTGESISLSHGDEDDDDETVEDVFNTLTEKQKKVVYALIGQALEGGEPDDISHGDEDDDDETVEDVFNTLTEKQKKVVYALIGQALENDDDLEGGDNSMKHNIFDTDTDNTLSHGDMQNFTNDVISDAKRYGSLKDSFIAHSQDYGIENIDFLFPDAKAVTDAPQFIQRDMGWVQKVMSGVHHTPFSRIKSVFADITEDEARAKGYIKGKQKKEEVFSLLKRTTTPTTVYKKQKLDRDDVTDITDFDVIAFLKAEMRMMLDEEIARALLVGDGRLASSDDKINEQNIRPIVKDDALYTIQASVSVDKNATDADKAKAFIRTAIKARKDYKGSGQPTLFTTEDVVTDCLLLEDAIGHYLYKDEADLAKTLRVKEIVIVPPMEGTKGKNDGALMGVIVNLNDYNIGADKGGAVNMFDDFDIDYNQMKYLIETRCSGALIKPYSAIALELAASGSVEDTEE